MLTQRRLSGKKLCVVVPARDEEALVARTLRKIPAEVACVVVVDDASRDATVSCVKELADPRVQLLEKATNGGVGSAILSGYERGLELDADVLVVMAGDDQMDPADLGALVAPIISGHADYVKGNRFLHPARDDMPRLRRWAGRLLARVTSLASGQRIGDSQCGYTAVSRETARLLLEADIWPRYGYPNDVLVLLGRRGRRVVEVPVRPVYGTEKSGVRAYHVLTILGLIVRRLWREARVRRRPTQAGVPGTLAAPASALLRRQGE